MKSAANLQDQALIENLECAIIVINASSLIERMNLAAETLFCQSRRHCLGKHLDRLIAITEVSQCITECFSQNAQFTLREQSISLPTEETLLADITLSAIKLNDIDPKVLIEINSVDRISRFIKEDNQLERQQSFRLMMRGLAHEIKNPLGGLRGAAQLLDRELQAAPQKELTEILIKEVDRLTRLVDRVMGSREKLKPEAVNIHELLEHVVQIIVRRQPTGLNIERFYDPTLPEIVVDKEQIIQALLNIVGNALECQTAMTESTIGLVTQFERNFTINHTVFRQVLKIMLWDRGPGVDAELYDKIFDPLITGRAEGTGLGLSITQEIAQRHKGVVKLEQYHGNTCFSVYLPYLAKSELTETMT